MRAVDRIRFVIVRLLSPVDPLPIAASHATIFPPRQAPGRRIMADGNGQVPPAQSPSLVHARPLAPPTQNRGPLHRPPAQSALLLHAAPMVGGFAPVHALPLQSFALKHGVSVPLPLQAPT